jgi:pimeloyl-ACP methyl ester carboxylesterase
VIQFNRIHMLLLASMSGACLTSSSGGTNGGGAPASTSDAGTDPGNNPASADPPACNGSVTSTFECVDYRPLATHPGCQPQPAYYTAYGQPGGPTTGFIYNTPGHPWNEGGYTCAAKEYTVPANEDTTKPIILLIHGNSDTPAEWETCNPGDGSSPVTSGCLPAATQGPMLGDQLLALGYHVIAVDQRYDLSDDPTGTDTKNDNPAKNMDHGWSVPIVQSFIQSAIAAYPNRMFSIVAFSLGPTVTRDALRRLHRAGVQPFQHIQTIVLASGAEHGVATYQSYCGNPASPDNVTMQGRVACEMGNRAAFTPTYFDTNLNGPLTSSPVAASADPSPFQGAFETPCADGNTAFGQSGVCGGHAVKYTTVVMQDEAQGSYQDEFTCQACSALLGANNTNIPLTAVDPTGYFYGNAQNQGLFQHHFGSIRSAQGIAIILSALTQ